MGTTRKMSQRYFCPAEYTTTNQKTNNSLSKDYLHPDDHAKQITDTPGFKPFTRKLTLNNTKLGLSGAEEE